MKAEHRKRKKVVKWYSERVLLALQSHTKYHPKLVATFIERDCRISSETSFACVLFEEHKKVKSNLKDHWGFTRYFFKFFYPTVYLILLHTPSFLLEIRVIIKISKNPCYPINVDWFSLEWSKKKYFFFEKKIQNGRLKKTEFFNHHQKLSNFFASFLFKLVTIYGTPRIFRNFDDYPDF